MKSISVVDELKEYREECFKLQDSYLNGLLSEDEYTHLLDLALLRSGQRLYYFGRVRELDGKILAAQHMTKTA